MNSIKHNLNGASSQGSSRKSSPIAIFFNSMRKGLRVASAANSYPPSKEALDRILSENK
jgi:hypothetical protein